MSPKRADAAVRTALLETAARLLADEGTAGLTLRRLADEVGTSTMAVYTHFGGMTELRREVRREGFTRLRAHLSGVEDTGDTVADLAVLGWAYYVNGTTNAHLYRVMFMEPDAATEGGEVGLDTFERLVSGVRRCVDAGRFSPADPVALATQCWAMDHGVVSLVLAGMLSLAQAQDTLTAMAITLFQGFGDDPRAAGRSIARARERVFGPNGSFAAEPSRGRPSRERTASGA